MKKLLLIVSSHEDAALLLPAAKVIGKLGCQQVWVWHSPILAVDPEKECSVIDAEIKALEAGEKQAAALGDYETAKSRKAEREKLLMNRSVEIRNAWKRVSPEARKASIGRYMEPLLNILNPSRDVKGVGVRVSQFPEHQEADLWIAGLNEVKAVLEQNGFKGGEFAMMWPGQLTGLRFPSPVEIPIVTALKEQHESEEQRKAAQPKVPVPSIPQKASREDELLGLHHFSLYKIAKGLNVKHEKRPKGDIIKDILAAEELASM
jgi:hypothetical protein